MSIKSFKIRIYNERNIQTKRQNHVKSSKKKLIESNKFESFDILSKKNLPKNKNNTHITSFTHTR